MARLIEYRIMLNLQQQKMAQDAGLSRFTLAYIERWFNIPESKRHISSHATMAKLARLVGVSKIDDIAEFAAMEELRVKRSTIL